MAVKALQTGGVYRQAAHDYRMPEKAETSSLRKSGKESQVSAGKLFSEDGTLSITELLKSLREEYSSVHITVGTSGGRLNIKEYAAAQGRGKHLYLSLAYLEQLKESPKKAAEGIQHIRDVLESLVGKYHNESIVNGNLLGAGAVIGRDGEAVFWTSSYRYNYAEDLKYRREQRQKEEQAQEKRKVYYDAAGMNAKVTSAKTVASAKSEKTRAYGKLYYLESCRRNKAYDQTGLKQQIAHAKNVISCIKKKIKNLEQEDQMKKKAEQAQEEQRRKEAMAIRRELEKLRRNNRIKEYIQLQKGSASYMSEMERREVLRRLGINWMEPAALQSYVPAVPGAGSSASGTPSGGIPASGVTVSISGMTSVNVAV